MGGGSPTYNYPEQPTYGEGMADALKAQVELLKGTGDFASTGSLESLLPLERDVRLKTAQTDTDVLKQTLLGNMTDAVTGTYDSEGRLVIGQQAGQDKTTSTTKKMKYNIRAEDAGYRNGKFKQYRIIVEHPQTGVTVKTSTHDGDSSYDAVKGFHKYTKDRYKDGVDVKIENKVAGDPQPIYAKDKNGNIIVDKSKAGQAGVIPASRLGDGMIDLLGDTRELTDFVNRPATEADVAAGLADEVGQNITVGEAGNRQAGFDEQGNFLGLSVLAEDIQRGNLSRQREADLADVERLADRYSAVMEDFKPASSSGLQGARDLLEEQRENLTGLRKATQADVDAGLASEVGETFQTGTGSGGPITIPTGDTFGGEVTAATMESAQVADPLQLKANTQFQGELATGEGNQDTLRSNLLVDARTALGQGLTEREQAQVANAARARQTLMGRTFDQSGAIAEAEARVAEDNARRMQNRAFAQSVLGQEAGLQQGDITRGMAQESEQAGLQQQVNLTQAQMDQQANAFDADAAQRTAMANQAQRQQANQFGVGARLDAEKANEQLRQQGLANYVNAVGNLSQIERESGLDPFQALLGRGGGTALQQGQSVFGQANYGLSSGPQYLNPEAGLGYISNMAANQANMYAANVAADASRSSGLMGGLGAIGGGLLQGAGAAGSFGTLFCWVAREVYGPTNPAWLQFRDWMLNESPQWFFNLYRKYGESFASWISNKPRLKGIIRRWMDSKIGDK